MNLIDSESFQPLYGIRRIRLYGIGKEKRSAIFIVDGADNESGGSGCQIIRESDTPVLQQPEITHKNVLAVNDRLDTSAGNLFHGGHRNFLRSVAESVSHNCFCNRMGASAFN